jgi:hypothetical protein
MNTLPERLVILHMNMVSHQPRVDAGKDEHGGGTWLGVTEFDLVARILNRHSTLGQSPHRRANPWPGSGAVPMVLSLAEDNSHVRTFHLPTYRSLLRAIRDR